MAQLSAFLKLEVSKYKDIDHILKKLEDDGEIQNIYDVFKALFDSEFKFTLQELFRIQNAKKEQLNLKRQCENNLLLFKNNLVLIVDMIIEKALRSTLSENKTKYEDGLEKTLTGADDEETGVGTSTSTVSPLPTKSKRKSRSKDKKAASKDPFLNLSLETKTPHTDKKSNFAQLSTSKVESPLVQVLNGTTTPTRRRETLNQSRDKSALETNQRVGTLSAQASRASLHDTAYNNPSAFVQSEFNHISGSVKFSRSPKSRDRHDLSPGPGSYPTQSSLRQSPSPKIGTAPKISWFDKIARNDSPGPHLYPSKHFCSK